jgi:apolipoprotein N-acyltransferase
MRHEQGVVSWKYSLLLTIAAGTLLYLGNNLSPVWWAVWLAPVPLLLLAFSSTAWAARGWVTVAVAGSMTAYLTYFRLVMPWPLTLLICLGQICLWLLVVMVARRIVLAYASAWTVFVYPVLWVAVDTLMAALLPDGNWSSMAYTQANVPVLVQTLSLGGVAGLLFLLNLPGSVIAVLFWHRHHSRSRAPALGLAAALLAGAVGYGVWQLHQPLDGSPMRVGLVSIDDAIGPHASQTYSAPIRARYDALVEQLAASGVHVIVLPEKIAVLKPVDVAAWQTHFSSIAAHANVWLEVGMGVDDGQHPRNHAWLFDPAGKLVEDYEKHYMAPPERVEHYATGSTWNVHRIDGNLFGLAICKDMHFAQLGRAYAQRNADVMVVPAWDFAYLDGWLASRMTMYRGVESGYAIVRASREGMLTVSDAHGRFLAQAMSSPMPGSTLIATVPVRARVSTVYSRLGYLFGWLCVAIGALIAIVCFMPGDLRRR